MKFHLPALLCGFLLTQIRAEVVTLPHPVEALPHERTVIWSPVFQAAWDRLNADFGGPPLRVEPPNALMAKLDSFRWDSEKVMPAGSWKAWCGPATRGFLDQVNAEAAAITKEADGPFDLTAENPENRAFFGLLDREVTFEREFFRSTKIPMMFRGKDSERAVRFFGVRGDASGEIGGSVRVLSWRPVDRSHAIQICCKDSDDTVIFYLPPKEQDFATACRWIRTWRSQFKIDAKSAGAWDDRILHSGDEIRIPYLTLESGADLTPLFGGARYYKNQKVPWRIVRAEQRTRFVLHEKGARVRVDVLGEAEPFAGGPPPNVPRRFMHERPFFVFLWRDQAEWPYFGAWIGDASAMKAFP